MKQFKLIFALLLAIFIAGCREDEPIISEIKAVADFDHEIMNKWNLAFLDIERYSEGYRPGPAPRGLAYLGLAAYEGCVSGMPSYKSLSGVWPGFNVPAADENKEYNWALVINETYHFLLPLFFSKASSQQLAKIEEVYLENLNKYKNGISEEVVERSIARGEDVAEIVWQFAKSDPIGHEHYLDPFQGYDWHDHFEKDGDWIPTVPGPGKGMGGIWGKARTFALKTDADKLCINPIPFSEVPTSELYSQALETYSQNTPELSYEKEWVSEYWSDDLLNLTFSPGPRWAAIGLQVLDLTNANLEQSIVLAAKLGMALNDASVGCWNSKYHYNLERPESYIKRVIDPNWEPSLYNPITKENGVTPSFPAYPSGHATMGGAGSEILASIFGYNFSMTDRCHEGRTEFLGEPRSFSSFSQMAQENGWSRIPLGVHFRMDSEVGISFGTNIARKVNNLPWTK